MANARSPWRGRRRRWHDPNQKCKCYFCRKWVLVSDAPMIRVDPTEGPSEYTTGRVCAECLKLGRHRSTDTAFRLGEKVEYPN